MRIFVLRWIHTEIKYGIKFKWTSCVAQAVDRWKWFAWNTYRYYLAKDITVTEEGENIPWDTLFKSSRRRWPAVLSRWRSVVFLMLEPWTVSISKYGDVLRRTKGFEVVAEFLLQFANGCYECTKVACTSTDSNVDSPKMLELALTWVWMSVDHVASILRLFAKTGSLEVYSQKYSWESSRDEGRYPFYGSERLMLTWEMDFIGWSRVTDEITSGSPLWDSEVTVRIPFPQPRSWPFFPSRNNTWGT